MRRHFDSLTGGQLDLSRRTLIGGGMLAALSSAAPAAPPGRPLGGWREALVIVPALDPWTEVLTVVGGWEVAWRDRSDVSLNALWTLPRSARAEQVVMRNRGETTGLIRLIRISGADQRRIRADDQAWETGGISALDFRVIDMTATRAALEARGWRAPSAPVRYEAYAGIDVIQWVPVSPDGVRLSFIQRIAPPLTGWPQLKRWSRAINAAMIVRDMPASARFFGDALGFPIGGRSKAIGGAGANVMGLPWRFQAEAAADILGFRPIGDDSAVELISIPAAQGRDHAAGAHPPNLGLAGLRFIVTDATALARNLAEGGTAIVAPLQPIAIAPYGKALAFSASTPDGVWLEFVQLGV